MDAKDELIAELRALVERLTQRVAVLKLELAKARKDSTTSSKPPSSDLTKAQPRRPPGRRLPATIGWMKSVAHGSDTPRGPE